MNTGWGLIATIACLILASSPLWAGQKVFRDGQGRIRVRPPEVPASCRNAPWPEGWEEGFWGRANHAIDAYRKPAGTATTGEHEKWHYPRLMFNYLTGEPQLQKHAIRGLQLLDGEQRHTKGIDLYWCFTLKGQARKYFYFGDLFEPDYRRRMREAMELWTRGDPKPTLELYRQTDHPDRDVRALARRYLRGMYRSPEQLPGLLENSRYEPFKDYMNKIKEDLADFQPTEKTPPDDWRDWAKLIMDGDWQVYEEYERLTNPRPHPVHGHGTGPIGGAWDPRVRGLWADGRNTDNLRAMRETTVYLFAEEAGSETVRKLYRDKLKTYVRGLYTVGMGEWDSENYHAHTIAPYLNLYDFARDEETKRLAKAALDWLTMAAALKYYRGGYGGPTKRDYGGASRVFGSGVTHMMYLYFDDCPVEDPKPHYDDVHAISSAYRPPKAVAALARRDFAKPVELLNTKPEYSHWRPGHHDAPQFFETLFYGDSYYLGSCVAKGGAGDVGAFKLLAYNSKRGVDYFLANTDHGRAFKCMLGNDQRAQYRNLLIWLRKDTDRDMIFQVPDSAATELEDGIWFLDCERTCLAVRPIHLKKGKKTDRIRGYSVPDGDSVQTFQNAGGPYSGFALEVGDKKTHGGLEGFKQAVKTRGKLDLSKLGDGTVALVGTDGRKLTATHNDENNLPRVVRDGRPRDWSSEFDLYKTAGADEGEGLVSLGWKDGTLRIEAGGHVFTETVAESGKVTFDEKPAR